MRKSRLIQGKQERLIEHFVAGATARTVAALVEVNKSAAAYYFQRLREVIYKATGDETPFCGEIGVDESYFGGRQKGNRGRGAAGKIPVFDLLKRDGKVYAKVIPNTRGKTLNRINHSRLFADKHNHINGIENFWNQAKRHMRKFNGVPKDQFPLFVKGLRMAI